MFHFVRALYIIYYTGLSNQWPAGSMGPEKQFCTAREVKYLNTKFLVQLTHMMKSNIQNFQKKICKIPLIFAHAARLMTRLTGVRPAVGLSWKALIYTDTSVK